MLNPTMTETPHLMKGSELTMSAVLRLQGSLDDKHSNFHTRSRRWCVPIRS